MKPPKPPDYFDPVKLESMTEPLAVRVERIRGQARTPIPLPQPVDGGPSGSGYDKGLIHGIEQWLQTEWCGGGSLRVTVTDSSAPPVTMSWLFFSPIPEKVPPPLAAAMGLPPQAATTQSPNNPQPPQPPQQVHMAPPNAYPYGLPPGLSMPVDPRTGQPHQQPQQFVYPPGFSPYGAYQPQQGQFYQQPQYRPSEAENARTELDLMRKQLAERDYEAKLNTERQANDARFKQLEGAFTTLTSKLESFFTGGGAPSRANAELDTIKRQLEETQRRAEEERRERELRDTIAAQHANTLRMIETMQGQFQTFMQTNANRGPDPMIGVIQEQMRMSIEAQKDIARGQSSALDKMSAFMMSPRDVVAMQRESQQGGDQIASQMGRAYGDMINIQTRMMEQMSQLGGSGGKTGLDIVDGMADRLGSIVGQWTKAKGQTERAQLEAQSSAAQAQARVVEAQSAAVRAQYDAAGRVGAPIEAGLSGATEPTHPSSNGQSKKNGQVISMQQPVEVLPIPAGRGGRSDEEWFGPLVTEVTKLREQVKLAIESSTFVPPRTDPKTGNLLGIVPQQVVLYIDQAAAMVQQAGLPIPALVDLYHQARWADFVEILIADAAPQGYKDAVIQLLAANPENEEDEDEDDDEAQAS